MYLLCDLSPESECMGFLSGCDFFPVNAVYSCIKKIKKKKLTTKKQKQNMNSCIIILVTHKTAGRLCEICSNIKKYLHASNFHSVFVVKCTS